MTRTFRELLTDDPHAIGYGLPHLYFDAAEEPRVGGETAYASPLGMRHYDGRYIDATLETATHVEVRNSAWGDYVGSDIDRSNARSLVRDFPDLFVTVEGDYSSEWLVINLDQPFEDDDIAYYAETLKALVDDYPLYDEQDHGELQYDLLLESWESYLESDSRSTYRDALTDAGMDDDDAYRESEDAPLRDWLESWLHSGDVELESESAVDVIVRGWEDMLKTQAGQRVDDLAAMARNPEVYGPPLTVSADQLTLED